MNDDRASSGNHTVTMRQNVVPATDRPVSIQSHPRRIQGLARSLAREQEELGIMRQEAIALVKKAIEGLGSFDRSSRPPVAEQLLSELEDALDELNSLEIEVLPRPEHVFAIAERLKQLNAKFPT